MGEGDRQVDRRHARAAAGPPALRRRSSCCFAATDRLTLGYFAWRPLVVRLLWALFIVATALNLRGAGAGAHARADAGAGRFLDRLLRGAGGADRRGVEPAVSLDAGAAGGDRRRHPGSPGGDRRLGADDAGGRARNPDRRRHQPRALLAVGGDGGDHGRCWRRTSPAPTAGCTRGRRRSVARAPRPTPARAPPRRRIAARDEFLAIAAHELRTPLTSLLLQIDAVERAVSLTPGGVLGERRARSASAPSRGRRAGCRASSTGCWTCRA